MKKIYSTIVTLALLIAVLGTSSCSKESDNTGNNSNAYEIIEINGNQYACYGYRSYDQYNKITYRSTWDLLNNRGTIILPCGELSDAEKGNYNYDYMLNIGIKGNQPLQKESRLEDFSPTLDISTSSSGWNYCNYVSGSAIITDIIDDKYITIRFDSFTFSNKSKYYTIIGSVQLLFWSYSTSL